MQQTSSWRLVAYLGLGAVGGTVLYWLVNGVEQQGWADPHQGTVASATIERSERSDTCGVSGRRSRCYHLSLAVGAPIDAARELDVNIEDAVAHRFDTGESTRVVALPDGTIALDRTLLAP